MKSGLNKERRRKLALSLPHTFAFSCLPRTCTCLADHKGVFVAKLYGFCLSIAYIVRRRHPYIESIDFLIVLHDNIIYKLPCTISEM